MYFLPTLSDNLPTGYDRIDATALNTKYNKITSLELNPAAFALSNIKAFDEFPKCKYKYYN